MQINNREQRRPLAVTLTVEDAVYSWLRGPKLGGNARLAPVGRALYFPEQGGDVFVHAHKHIRERIGLQYSNG